MHGQVDCESSKTSDEMRNYHLDKFYKWVTGLSEEQSTRQCIKN